MRRIPPVGRVLRAVISQKAPVYAHYGITHRCDLQCRMCGIWRYGNKEEELNIDEIRQMAAIMKRLGVIQVAIGGGEPLIREDIEDVVSAFIDQGVNLRLLTNGVGATPARLKKLVELGLTDFSISLDSLYPKRFDYICQREGAWEQVVQNMTIIADLLRNKKAMTTINCVVSHINLEELPDLTEFARDLGFGISFLPVELAPEPGSKPLTWEDRFIRFQKDMAIPQDQTVHQRVDRAYEQLIKMKHEGAPIQNTTPYLKASQQYLKTGRFPLMTCDAGRLYFSVAPDGSYTICHRTQHQHGHILKPDFETYIKSEEYERLRLQEVASCEGCMRACWIDTSYMFRTLTGLIDTSRLVLSGRTKSPLTWEQARKRARYDLDNNRSF